MSITINDPVLLQQLRSSDDFVLLEGPEGEILGRFYVSNGRLPPGVKSPFTDAELAELRKQKTGRKLADVMRDLEQGKIP